MERLSSEKDLETFLLKQRDRSMTIVSAFASGTDDLLKVIAARNRVELVLGTINAFTSPSFIDNAKVILGEHLWVDFRGNASIHWKLYLISPNMIVLGSANFTNQGVKLGQDTCVVLKSASLYNDYLLQVDLLKRAKRVLSARSDGFDNELATHRDRHRRHQAALQAAHQASQGVSTGRASEVPTFHAWAKQGFLSIPLFVWQTEHTTLEKAEAAKITRSHAAPVRQVARLAKARRSAYAVSYKDFLTECIDGPSAPFEHGTIVLSMNVRGAHMRFMQLDVIVRSAKFGCDFMIERRKARYPRLFDLTPAVRAAITRLISKPRIRENYSIPVEALQAELRNN